MEVPELWCQWFLFCLDQGCIADYQKWDEHAEEQIRWQSRIKSFPVKLYILLDAHLLAID
jgi:hypothetical protein